MPVFKFAVVQSIIVKVLIGGTKKEEGDQILQITMLNTIYYVQYDLQLM